MKNDTVALVILMMIIFGLILLFVFRNIYQTHTPMLVGKWQEIGRTATLEFSKDGSFRAVDNQGMAVSGKYTFIEDGNVRFEIVHQGSYPEILIGKITVQGDELTIFSKNDKEVERYRRVK